MRQYTPDFLAGEHYRQAGFSLQAPKPIQPTGFRFQYFAIQEDQCIQRLGLRAGGDLAMADEVVEKPLVILLPQLGGMTLVMKKNIARNQNT